MTDKGVDVLETRPLVMLRRYVTVGQAEADRMALDAVGVPAWVSNEILGTMFPLGIGARLLVRMEDEATAREVLSSGAVPGSELPPDIAEPPCPRCGSLEVSQRVELVEGTILADSSRVWRYVCGSCGQSWSDAAAE